MAVQAAVLRRRADTAGGDNAEAYATARRWLAARAEPAATGRDGMLRAALLGAADALVVVTARPRTTPPWPPIAADCPPELERPTPRRRRSCSGGAAPTPARRRWSTSTSR